MVRAARIQSKRTPKAYSFEVTPFDQLSNLPEGTFAASAISTFHVKYNSAWYEVKHGPIPAKQFTKAFNVDLLTVAPTPVETMVTLNYGKGLLILGKRDVSRWERRNYYSRLLLSSIHWNDVKDKPVLSSDHGMCLLTRTDSGNEDYDETNASACYTTTRDPCFKTLDLWNNFTDSMRAPILGLVEIIGGDE
jgi:hypothetical protein